MARRARGFTLLEMVLVMAIIAGASLLAMAAFGGGTRGMKLRGAAQDVAAQLRYARAVAISTGEPQDFAIDPAGHRWQGAKERSGSLPEDVEIVFTGAREVQPEEGVGAVRFFPDGAATGGRVRLLVDGVGMDVDVRWLTGEVRVRRMAEE